MKWFSVVLVGLILTACSTYSDDELADFDKRIQDYMKKENVECTKSDSGLYFDIKEQGEGELIQFRDKVSFTYTGSFLDGEVFDEQKEPVEFTVSELIPAWKEIMLQMKKGGKVFLIAPPQLGYGTNELDDIPKSSILVYDLEIVEVK